MYTGAVLTELENTFVRYCYAIIMLVNTGYLLLIKLSLQSSPIYFGKD